MTTVSELHSAFQREMQKTIIGHDDAMRLLLIALICEGHVLLEGVPGVAKTMMARALSASLGMRFQRVQFTPDLMPSDILGTQIYDFQEGRFHLVEGPVFTNLLLADEINRAPAKTQSALLEAMQERQITIGGATQSLPQPFLVVATQNPVEQQGTYPLPEAQLDRFLFKVSLGYPDVDAELAILAQHRGDTAGATALLDSIEPVADPAVLAAAKQQALDARVEAELARYVIELVRRTRDHVHVQLGGSPRASLMLQIAARVTAALDGRDYVIPDDVKELFVPALRHRIVLTASAEVEGRTSEQVLREISDSVAVPR